MLHAVLRLSFLLVFRPRNHDRGAVGLAIEHLLIADSTQNIASVIHRILTVRGISSSGRATTEERWHLVFRPRNDRGAVGLAIEHSRNDRGAVGLAIEHLLIASVGLTIEHLLISSFGRATTTEERSVSRSNTSSSRLPTEERSVSRSNTS